MKADEGTCVDVSTLRGQIHQAIRQDERHKAGGSSTAGLDDLLPTFSV
jgi:hypothetical protein